MGTRSLPLSVNLLICVLIAALEPPALPGLPGAVVRAARRLRGLVSDVVHMGTQIVTAAQNASVAAVTALVDAGTTNAAGKLRIYHSDGTTLLAEGAVANPAFGGPVAGVATASAIAQITASAGGTATTWRVVDRDLTEVMRGDITATSGGGSMEISNTTIANGDKIDITSFTYTQPAGSV